MRKFLAVLSRVSLVIACFLVVVSTGANSMSLPKKPPIIMYSDNPQG
jgi:hypothetical protein